MFKAIFLLLPLASLFLVAPRSKMLTLELSTRDCRNNEHDLHRFQDTIVFIQEGKVYKTVIPMNYDSWPIEIKNFKSGTYAVSYRNLYGQNVTRTVTIPEVNEYSLELCADELEAYPLNSLDGLQKGDSIKIYYTTRGCFHWGSDTLYITKTDNELLATMYDKNKWRSVILTPDMQNGFIRFENELNVIGYYDGCTTYDDYKMVTPERITEKHDGGCSWRGFFHLRSLLFTAPE